MRHLDRVHVPQLDLFRPASPRPDWWQLPADTRERVLRLITRLLRERRNVRIGAQGDHDAVVRASWPAPGVPFQCELVGLHDPQHLFGIDVGVALGLFAAGSPAG